MKNNKVTEKITPKEIDMDERKSLEFKNMFSAVNKLIGWCVCILIILCFLYVFTLNCNKDASGILNVINVLIGVIIGGIISQATAAILIDRK